MKTGIITGTGSNTALIGIVAPVSPTVLSLAATALQLLQSDPLGTLRIVHIDLNNRKIRSKVSVSGDYALLVAASGGGTGFVQTEVSFADLTKNSSVVDLKVGGTSILTPLGTPPTRSSFGDYLDSQFGFSNSAMSVSSVIGNVEDALIGALAGTPPVDVGVNIIYDQFEDKFSILETLSADAPVDADLTAALTWDSTFPQAVQGASGTGPFNI
jgi:hypothetical protein